VSAKKKNGKQAAEAQAILDEVFSGRRRGLRRPSLRTSVNRLGQIVARLERTRAAQTQQGGK
jgi:hypothetical protein